jgi:precorrin-6B C5,15-methyltransferase / cobalt-precorrin-6B C5,C15-methyltransferase
MNRIHLLGIDSIHLPPEKVEILQSCATIFSAERFLDLLRPILVGHPDIQVLPVSPIAQAIARMEEMLDVADIAVLVGGDPLFFGIGRNLCRRFGQEIIQIQPAVSSMQLAFARFKIPWDDADFISVHGRPMESLVAQIGALTKVFLLTDAVNSPDVIAASLLSSIGERNACHYVVHVAEDLGGENERLTTASLQEIVKGAFGELNVMIITRKVDENQCVSPRFGLQEQEIIHSRGLITKNEVRAATIHALRLPDTGVFWDIGAGSGSVSLETARLLPMLQIFAVERKAEHTLNILANRQVFYTWNLTAIQGEAPGILAILPDPDRIFIGGGGGGLKDILEQSIVRLKPGGIIVVNAVIEKTRLTAPEILHQMGLTVSMATVSVSRSNYPENQIIEFNPITVITGLKPVITPNKGIL